MQGGSTGEHEQLGTREREETTVREVGYVPQKPKGQKVWGAVANMGTCYRKFP